MINLKKPLTMTPDEIMAWEDKDETKRKITPVKFSSETKESGQTEFLLVKPTKTIISSVAATAKEGKIEKANDMIINGCVVAGDMEEVQQDQDLYYGLVEEIGKMFEAKKKI